MKDPKYEFVERTQINLRNTSEMLCNREEEPVEFYYVTNMLNHCLGLISYVYQYAEDESNRLAETDSNSNRLDTLGQILDSITHDIKYDPSKYGDVKVCYPKWGNVNVSSIEISSIIYRMRNAICHNNIEFINGKDANGRNNIERIRFTDGRDNHNPRFDATMSIRQLKTLVLDISDAYLKYYKQSKTIK